jgi:hypothetical protein
MSSAGISERVSVVERYNKNVTALLNSPELLGDLAGATVLGAKKLHGGERDGVIVAAPRDDCRRNAVNLKFLHQPSANSLGTIQIEKRQSEPPNC